LCNWLRYRKSIFDQAGDMELHPIANEGFDFFEGVTHHAEAGKIEGIGAPSPIFARS